MHIVNDLARDERRQIRAVARELLDDRRAEERIFLTGRQEHGVQLRIDLLVDERHLKLVFKVRVRAQALDDHRTLREGLGVFGEQAVERVHLHIGEAADDAARERHALLAGKHGVQLAGVGHDAHDDAVENAGRAADDVQVAEREWGQSCRDKWLFHRGSPCIQIHGSLP